MDASSKFTRSGRTVSAAFLTIGLVLTSAGSVSAQDFEMRVAGWAESSDLIRSEANASKCFHKERPDWNNGNPIHLWDCDAGSDAMKTWRYDPATNYIRSAENPDKCLHKKLRGWDNGNPIHLWDCDAGSEAMKTWKFDRTTGYIRSAVNPEKCMHKKWRGWDNGNPVHLWDCDAGAARMKTWTRSSTKSTRRAARCVADVPTTFAGIPAKVKKKQYLGAHNHVIPGPHYTFDILKNNELNWALNPKKVFNFGSEHFQGIQRKGRHLILSGGLKYDDPKKAQLIIIEMGSRPVREPWSIPEYPRSHKSPHPSDRIVEVVDLDQRLWHAGGIQRDGDVLAVGLFGDGGSEVRFYDIQQPTRPTEIAGARVERSSKSYAAGLTTLPDGHRLLVAWDDKYLEFYRSRSTDLEDGFGPRIGRVHKNEVGEGANIMGMGGGLTPGGCPDVGDLITKGHAGPCGSFQNINLVTDCDGTVYLLGFRNTNANIKGKGGDHAGLYEIRWPDGFDASPIVEPVDRKHMYCYGPCNFGGGAGIYRSGSDFFIYGVAPYLHGGNDRVNFNEYAGGS